MKKNIFFISFLFLYSLTFGQKAVGSQEAIAHFFKTKTCVVLDDNIFNVYNSAIQEAVKAAWYLTDYEFISTDEFEKRMDNPDYSFLVRTKVFPSNDPNGTAYTFLSVLIGKKGGGFEDLPEICSFPLSYYGVEYEKYDYKMATLLLFMQRHIEITRDNPDLNEKNILRYYNKNKEKINGKTIYFTQEDLASDVNTISKIKKYYTGKVKIVSEEEIEKAVAERAKNIIILHKVSPPKNYKGKKDRCYKMLVGTENGELYYFDFHKINDKKPDKFLKSDFKKLSKQN